MKKNVINILFSTVFGIASVFAQPKIGLARYEDDFSYLKNEPGKKNLDKLKYIGLGANTFLSVGAELREQFQFYGNTNFGDVPPGYRRDASQLWHRFMAHASIESGEHWRFFLQLNNTLRLFNDNPRLAEIDENQLSLHQAFAEYRLKDWTFRLGQQEMYYGSHRLITLREGPNTRLAFDGLVVRRKFRTGSIDGFAVSKVISKRYAFDDESMHDGLYGLYGTQYFSSGRLGLDYYLVEFQSNARQYDYHSGFENRETCGIRLFSNLRAFNFEFEAAYQTGNFDGLTIDAYNFLADINIPVLPQIHGVAGFAVQVASGDKNPDDHKLNTYNLLYAKPAFGLGAPIGATNIVSLYPYFKLHPTKRLSVLAEVFFLARNSTHDGLYSPGMVQTRPGPNASTPTPRRALGEFYVLESLYEQNKNLTIAFDFSYLDAGGYAKTTGKGKDIVYLSFKSTYKF